MIKAEVTVVGTVTHAAQIKQRKNGDYFYSARLVSSIPMKEGGFKEVSVSLNSSQGSPAGLDSLSPGQHVRMKGTLYFKKVENQHYFDLTVNVTEVVNAGVPNNISGELFMIGVVGSKGPEIHNCRNGNSLMSLSAYSGDGNDSDRVYTWVRFTRFGGDIEPFLVPKMLIQANGELDLQYYKDKLSLNCRLKNIQPYAKTGGVDTSLDTTNSISETPSIDIE